MKLKQLMAVTIAGLQFIAPALAAEDPATNSTAAEIEALKKEVQELSQKVHDLEQQRALAQPAVRVANQEQIQELDQKVRILGRQRELDQETAAAAAKTQPRLTLGANGVTFSSADTNFAISLHGVLQVDSRTFEKNDNVPGNDSIMLRRARPILSGTVFRDFV